MFNFKFTQDPNDIRIALNVIFDGVAALILIPIVHFALGFTEVPVRILTFGILMLAVGAIVYYAVNRQIPAPEPPVVETEDAEVVVDNIQKTIKIPKMPEYPPTGGPDSAIRYRDNRHAIVLTPYVLLAACVAFMAIKMLSGEVSVQAANGLLLLIELLCVALIVFDRRHDGRVVTVLVILLFVATIIFVWTSREQINIYYGQLVLVAAVVTLKWYLWSRTWIVASKKLILYVIKPPVTSFAPSIEIRAASAPNITQSLLDTALNTCTVHLDTSSNENGRFKAVRFVKRPDEIRPLFGQPTSTEFKKSIREAKLQRKVLKTKRRQERKDNKMH